MRISWGIRMVLVVFLAVNEPPQDKTTNKASRGRQRNRETESPTSKLNVERKRALG